MNFVIMINNKTDALKYWRQFDLYNITKTKQQRVKYKFIVSVRLLKMKIRRKNFCTYCEYRHQRR